MPAAPTRQLLRLQARLRKHTAALAALARADFVLRGSLMQRYLPCGTASCRCHTDSAQLHGPYWQWSTRVRGKSVTRMLTPEQAQRYQAWMHNGQRLEAILTELHDISIQATGLLLAQARSQHPRQSAGARKPSRRRPKLRKSVK